MKRTVLSKFLYIYSLGGGVLPSHLFVSCVLRAKIALLIQ